MALNDVSVSGATIAAWLTSLAASPADADGFIVGMKAVLRQPGMPPCDVDLWTLVARACAVRHILKLVHLHL